MKTKLFILSVWLLTFFWYGPYAVAQEKNIVIAIEDNWPPFADSNYKDGGLG